MSHPADHLRDDDALANRLAGRLSRRLALAGFGLMFVAALLLWTQFGPTMFMDLATTIASCF